MDVKNYETRNWRLIFIDMEQLEKIKKFLQTDFAKQSLESLSIITQMYGEDEISQTLYYYEGNEFPEFYYDPYIGRNGVKELKSGPLRQFLESLYELIQENMVEIFEDEIDKYDSFHSISFFVDLNFETKKLDLTSSITVYDTEYSTHEFEVTDTNVIESKLAKKNFGATYSMEELDHAIDLTTSPNQQENEKKIY